MIVLTLIDATPTFGMAFMISVSLVMRYYDGLPICYVDYEFGQKN